MSSKITRRALLQAGCGVGSALIAGEIVGAEGSGTRMKDEVRYEYLRPSEMVAKRKACPVAYLPIGTLEWHLAHNPLGLDAVKAHGLCVECAKRGGGIVFPPLFYGENRTEAHLDREKADVFDLPKENFTNFAPFTVSEQASNYQHLLIHILNEIASLGFRFIIVCAGHYPLLDHGRAAISVFRQTARRVSSQPTTGWVFTGYELVQDLFPGAGDHGGAWETSIMMALDKDSVDLSLLSEDEPWVKKVSVEYGRKAIDAIVKRVLERVDDMRANPDKYLGHYTPM